MAYTDEAGLRSRADSAMLRIGAIIQRVELDSGARLALIATVMEEEPILTDPSPAAIKARTNAARRGEYRKREVLQNDGGHGQD
jgi:hypothetical protein